MADPSLDERTFDAGQFRRILGRYPTGVVIVSAFDENGHPTGMTVGSFTSVSLEPPLIAFFPDHKSDSWKSLKRAGRDFCVNILGDDQEEICRLVASRKVDKFRGIPWRTSPGSLPLIEGCVAYLDCSVEDIRDAGDHQFVLGRVRHLALENPVDPLLFLRGGYGSFAARTHAPSVTYVPRPSIERQTADDAGGK